MAEKKKVAPPIDRPLSKAYLRSFTGWSTAYPPGLSDPTSCRVMENMLVDRNGGLMLRPGLRYASYTNTPNLVDTEKHHYGTALAHIDETAPMSTIEGREMVGTLEPFYLHNGTRAYLFAVRETDGTVGFRVLSFSNLHDMVQSITASGLICPQGEETVRFSPATKYVSYVQIDNRILAMSDAGESVLLFFVGGQKLAKRLNTINVPEWKDEQKPVVRHPEANWILKNPGEVRRNELRNASFTRGTERWHRDGGHTEWDIIVSDDAPHGSRYLRVMSEPSRKNLVHAPLHRVADLPNKPGSGYGTEGWHSGYGDPKLQKRDDHMRIFDEKGKGLFLADSAHFGGIKAGRKYRLAFTFECSERTDVKARVRFYRNNGAQIGDTIKMNPDERKLSGRFESRAIEAPDHAVSAMIRIGATSETKAESWVKVKDVMFVRDGEPLGIFSGDSDRSWWEDGKTNKAASIQWPSTEVIVKSNIVPIVPGEEVAASINVNGERRDPDKPNQLEYLPLEVKVILETFNKNEKVVDSKEITHTTTKNKRDSHGNLLEMKWTRTADILIGKNSKAVSARITIKTSLAALEMMHLDGAMIVSDRIATQPFFTGATPSQGNILYSWDKADKPPHLSASIETKKLYDDADFYKFPEKSQPSTANTLVATGGRTKNPYKFGFFYTFENEFGETPPSKVTEIRTQRGSAQWLWEKPKLATDGTTGDPSGVETVIADQCCDQLAVQVPKDVFDGAVASGATRWNLYMFEWNEQEPVPIEARLIDYVDIYKDAEGSVLKSPITYDLGGWIRVTPNRKMFLELAPLPTKGERRNYSKPPKTRNGIVAGDRIILVGDADEMATVKWSSNRQGSYTNFTPTKSGGVKTLSSGNLYIPGAAVLWQNPQSVDTITILCIGSDGSSTCYYMSPSEVTGQNSSTQIMGFEETTNTPGSVAPYGVLVHNNALFRPLDRGLLKTTAQNYNINHKLLTDDIQNMWIDLIDKQWIIGCVHDNRLYFLVKNPRGEPLEAGCLGNEIWVYDLGVGDAGAWSRFLIQGSALKVIEYGPRVYVGVCRPDGFFYLDPDAREDDYVGVDLKVRQRPIPWYFEMNTQGANRAHDAWSHLQQVNVTFGNYYGAARYGIKARTLHGQNIDISKEFQDFTPDLDNEGLLWDMEDYLLVRRDMKEWFFYAGSVEGKPGSGQINFVQYRYTPVSVNVGYEYGSPETFEYGRNTLLGEDAYSTSGVPRPAQDLPWQRNT